MGGCCSVSISCDQFLSDVVNQVTQCLCVHASYIHDIKKNLTALETTMEELKAMRDDLLRRVEREENRDLQRLALIQVVSLWVLLNLEEVENLKSSGDFEEVTQQAPISKVVERPIPSEIIGQETVLEKAWNNIVKDGVGILGLYGMGGVGKTTLLEQINNKFRESAFDVVIWVVVSKDLQVQAIQDEVAKKLGLDGEDWNRKSKDQKACDILSVLRRKKFVLLLDDIWAKVDLKQIEVPFPNRENESKVIFTTRSQEVCGRMGVDDPMEVQCLSPEDALDLFQKKVGEKTLGSHPDIPDLAKVVVNKCRGLPLALNVIGETMSFKRTIEEWHRAIHVLTSNATAFSGMEDDILPILKYSYDDLKGEKIKSCLQYCALFPEDERIRKDDLIEYWICEGIIDDNEGIGNAMEQGYEITCSLVRSSLLMEGDKFIVHMHDVVREMALWIACDFGEQKNNFVVHAGGGLCEMPKLKNWNAVKRLSLMANKIDHISRSYECLQLTTLFLQRNKLSLGNISGEFFKSMLKLVVLDLSYNKDLSELPDEISDLVSLKYLNISNTAIRCLPVGLQKLKNLIHLDLEGTEELLIIIGISALLSLKVLKLLYSRAAYSFKAMEELKVLEHLEILTISIHSDSVLHEFLSSQNLVCCTEGLEIKSCRLESADIWCLSRMEKLCELYLIKCTISEIKMDTGSITREMVSPLQNLKNTFFLSLSIIYVVSCNPKDFTWLMFAPNLTVLKVYWSYEVEEIINKEKACEGEESGIVPFQKLEYLQLRDLPKLKNIYWRPLPLPCLKEIEVSRCPKLRKIPLNSKSGEKGLMVKYAEREWIEEVEWEDEATKARFLPSSRSSK